MKKILIIVSALISFSLQAKSLSIQEVLGLKLGEPLGKTASEAEAKGYDYVIETTDGAIKSIVLNFNPPLAQGAYLKKEAKGYCLVQGMGGDIKLNQFYFFPAKENRRYELTQNNLIRSILVKDLPAVKSNKACSLAELFKLTPDDKTLKLVK